MANSPEPTKFPFLALPRELRDQIYSYALAPVNDQERFPHDTYIIDFDIGRKAGYTDLTIRIHKDNIPGIAILYASKQIYDEATTALYGGTPFRLEADRGIPHFFAMIGHKNASKIRHLIIAERAIGAHNSRLRYYAAKGRSGHVPTNTRLSREAITGACTGLTTLEIIKCVIPDPRITSVELLCEELSGIDRELVKALPALRSTTLAVSATREDLCTPHGAHFSRFVMEEIGWRIKLVKVDYVSDPDPDENGSLSAVGTKFTRFWWRSERSGIWIR